MPLLKDYTRKDKDGRQFETEMTGRSRPLCHFLHQSEKIEVQHKFLTSLNDFNVFF